MFYPSCLARAALNFFKIYNNLFVPLMHSAREAPEPSLSVTRREIKKTSIYMNEIHPSFFFLHSSYPHIKRIGPAKLGSGARSRALLLKCNDCFTFLHSHHSPPTRLVIIRRLFHYLPVDDAAIMLKICCLCRPILGQCCFTDWGWAVVASFLICQYLSIAGQPKSEMT